MQKTETVLALKTAKIVAVVRGDSKAEAYKTAEACIDGGVKAIELTFTAPAADQIIDELNKKYFLDKDVIIGAGTVLDAMTARIAIMSGAKFIVSPAFDKETALLCNEYQIPYMPGCMTITEIQTAMRYGAEVVKVFPGSTVSWDFVKAVKAPLPYVNIMPTGGVNLDNMSSWFKAGAVIVGTGSDLTGAARQQDFASVKKRAEAYHQEILRIQGECD